MTTKLKYSQYIVKCTRPNCEGGEISISGDTVDAEKSNFRGVSASGNPMLATPIPRPTCEGGRIFITNDSVDAEKSNFRGVSASGNPMLDPPIKEPNLPILPLLSKSDYNREPTTNHWKQITIRKKQDCLIFLIKINHNIKM